MELKRAIVIAVISVGFVTIQERVEPFRSHFWLTLLGVIFLGVAAALLKYWLERRRAGPLP